ncbi:MAG TPA: SUMF1/EgtB/PvdO family nonheme iron enzyme [Rubrivivax sp.]|nr:SUMF1/EgtB/PvdO family nonheme iron enzyme [Rubrivivax sp.]
MSLRTRALDDPFSIRHADTGLLSLALMDARNLTLRWLAVFEARGAQARTDGGASALWLVARAGWYQERWIARNLQRARGDRADLDAACLSSIEPGADGWFEAEDGLPDAEGLRAYLEQTMETTLDLLASTASADEDLHFYRAALLHEDRIGEALAERAAALQLRRQGDPPPPWATLPGRSDREPLLMPAARLRLGSEHGGFVPDAERWAEELAVPEFEIDAQPVNWARFAEFAEDGGYQRAELWSETGWAWAQRSARRAPRDVEQLRGGVLVQRGGELQRAGATQPVMHVSRHEAEAWCRWAGRRLPTEPEWELAALTARNRGFAWGDVFEWVAGSARPWAGYAPTAGALDRMPPAGTQGVLRGGSFMTPARQRHPKARRFLAPHADHAFAGFRSCAP